MNALPDDKQKLLRENGLMRDNEVAYAAGDLLVVENVVTRERRTLTVATVQPLFENTRRVLRG
jgi:hypothetical protein